MTIALLGRDGGLVRGTADFEIIVPSNDTARIQEVHTFILHQWLDKVDNLSWDDFGDTFGRELQEVKNRDYCDLILDHYIWGEVSRISPEAPVPVVRVIRDTYSPGGAANVACNLAALE